MVMMLHIASCSDRFPIPLFRRKTNCDVQTGKVFLDRPLAHNVKQ